ncbi:MAG: aminotransferase class V-fold PLP-dependent enzyme [Gammaproteobacteria bacterium]|jgi:glutamate/tyrosine decarboxylase-like PLP-dependent enzyme|nr:aminotransferase class V-fold PLP-dependent enzyme [Gammaproteobacteria bacterium]HJN94738.1 aminotransferase class V-fold PLP-dependent enzyme [Gammaproteobacteria bacterium]|tara:strand:- start:2300 stop:3553 length:1254 start_codon:yes stop_codon:yes gene_type:complete
MDAMDDVRVVKSMPREGMAFDAIKDHLDQLQVPAPYDHFARAFRGPKDVQDVGKFAFEKFMGDNGFFSLYLPYMQTIEQEVIAMGVSLLHPQETSTGNFTSGGTESNFSALHAARNWAREHKPRVKNPNIVAPVTIHPSLQKGARYLNMEVITTDLDENGRGVPENIAAAINDDTVMIAASAPSWHYANIDPIPEIAEIAKNAGLWMHVDGCVGGYISPFLEKLGEKLTPWDFRVPGVMSISADLHKYGYCQKPASTIFWREAALQDYHYVTIDDPFLGQYKLAGFAGSRSAGPIFAAWAVFNYLGEEGYLRLARSVLELKHKLTLEVNAIEGLKMWDVDVMPMHFHSEKAPTSAVYQGLSDKGWLVLGLVEPEAITICVDAAFSEGGAQCFVDDLRDVTEGILAGTGSKTGNIRYS